MEAVLRRVVADMRTCIISWRNIQESPINKDLCLALNISSRIFSPS